MAEQKSIQLTSRQKLIIKEGNLDLGNIESSLIRKSPKFPEFTSQVQSKSLTYSINI